MRLVPFLCSYGREPALSEAEGLGEGSAVYANISGSRERNHTKPRYM